jgi:transketolase
MALEDLAMMRSIPNSVVFYPSDAVSTERAVVLAANHKGIVFIRTSRPNTDILYENNETFEIGKSKIVKQHENDVILLVGGGVTLHECHKASKILESQGVHARVMDVFSVKPFDKELFIKNAQ